MRLVGAYVVDGHLFFKMRDGSTVRYYGANATILRGRMSAIPGDGVS